MQSKNDPKFHPLSFSPAMARAYYAGRKSQTRRVIVPQPEYLQADGTIKRLEQIDPALWPLACERMVRDDKYQVGDRLWVREALVRSPGGHVWYECDQSYALGPEGERWPVWTWKDKRLIGRYMPRWACRATPRDPAGADRTGAGHHRGGCRARGDRVFRPRP